MLSLHVFKAGVGEIASSLLLPFVLILITLFLFMMPTTKFKGLIAVGLNSIHHLYRSWPWLHALGRYKIDRKAPKGLPHLENVEKVSDRVFRVLGLNPGSHTLQGTNTWLITGLASEEHILIDTGEDITAEKYVQLLFEEVFPQAGTKRLSKILLTHGHGDHQGGVSIIMKELQAKGMLPLPTVHKRKIDGGGDFPARGFHCEHIVDREVFHVDGKTTLQAMYTPGHTDDHVAFILREDNALLSGDCVLGCGTAVFDSLYEYMNSLQNIRQLIITSTTTTAAAASTNETAAAGAVGDKVYPVHTIYPGHGPVIRGDALAKIDEYVAHRMQREEQIITTLLNDHIATNTITSSGSSSNSNSNSGLTSWDIVGKVYGQLPLMVKVSAQWNVLHHLDKLKVEGKVAYTWPDTWTATAAT